MRRLYLLRHAKTEPGEPGKPDRNRALTERGESDAGTIGAYMESHALIPDRVALSSSLRTQRTWKLMAAAMRATPQAVTADGIYIAAASDIFDFIRDTPADTGSLMILGHNPTLHEVALTLVATGDIDTRERLREGLPTMGLVVIDFAFDAWKKLHPQSGRLERFVTPKSLDPATR
ncbi:MAG TPA: histidine phosphatase family protein [Pseudolabrys sp.]|nr:histidine phosphatase family protein [Pseudolabrys sp.]